MMNRKLALAVVVLAISAVAARPDAKTSLNVVVMDPLALPLSCPCVKGYAQRDYDQLGSYLEQKLGRPVKVAFAESLVTALKEKTDAKADLVIGKYSVVNFDAKRTGLTLSPIAALTGKDGKTTQTGLVVVLKDDPAKKIEDLKDYKILYGNVEADEKHAAVMKMFKNHQFVIPAKPTTCAACDEGALKLMEMGKAGEKGAAVISSLILSLALSSTFGRDRNPNRDNLEGPSESPPQVIDARNKADAAYQRGEYAQVVEVSTWLIENYPNDNVHVAYHLRGSAKVELGRIASSGKQVRDGRGRVRCVKNRRPCDDPVTPRPRSVADILGRYSSIDLDRQGNS
jgi:hypothetical protein